MRHFYIILLLIAIFIDVQQLKAQFAADWIEISDKVPASLPEGDFLDVHFIGDKGWITFDELFNNSGVILYTDNAGSSFSVQTFPEKPNVIEMVNSEIGFVGCLSGNVYFTTNGGEQWNLISGSLGAEIYGIETIADPLVGYVCGKYGWISKFDTNQVYKPQKPFGNWLIYVDLFDLEFPIDTNEGWVCGEKTIGHLSNNTWDSLVVPPCHTYYALSFVDEKTGWCAGGQGIFMTPEIVHTTDGVIWQDQIHPLIDQWLYDIFFLDREVGWTAGMYILATINGGETWVKEAQNFGNVWEAVYAVDGSAVYVVGRNKRILKKDLIISVEELTPTILLNIYPNPFTTSTTFEYTLPKPCDVHITIYNVQGQIVGRMQERQDKGVQRVEWNPEGLSAGIYYYRIVAGEQIGSGKIVISD